MIQLKEWMNSTENARFKTWHVKLDIYERIIGFDIILLSWTIENRGHFSNDVRNWAVHLIPRY